MELDPHIRILQLLISGFNCRRQEYNVVALIKHRPRELRSLENKSNIMLEVDSKQLILYKEMSQGRLERQAAGKWRDLGLEKRKRIWITLIHNKRASISLSKRILVAFLC